MCRIHFHKRLCLGFFVLGLCLGQDQHTGDTWERMLQDAYSAHFDRVRAELPFHSGLPPLLDLSKGKFDDSVRGPAFENYWKTLRSTPYQDPGVSGPTTATSTTRTFIDGPREFVLPITFCDAILIAEPITANAIISRSRTLIYSRFSFRLIEVLSRRNHSRFIQGSEIVAFAYGGSVRFPSGYLQTFLMSGSGFPEIGKRYVIFLFKIKDSNTYQFAIGRTFLLDRNFAFPVDRIRDRSPYHESMQLKDFEAQLQLAIKKNVNVE